MGVLERHQPSADPTARDLLRVQENVERALVRIYDEVTALEWVPADGAGLYGKAWADNGGTIQPVQIAKDASGRVYLRGTAGFGVKLPALFALPSTVLALPQGAIPASDRCFVVNSAGAFGVLWIYGKTNSQAGQVVLTVGASGTLSLDGIQFEAGA